MSRTETPRERALRRMLAADRRSNETGSREDWDAWQCAATDYWVLIHPELARLRRGDPARTPTAAEMRERAQAVAGAMEEVPETWRQGA